MWGTPADASLDITTLLDAMKALNIEGPVGRFASLEDLLHTARLNTQVKIAGGADTTAGRHAFALFVLGLLDVKRRSDIATAFAGDPLARARWLPLLRAAGDAWQTLPGERMVAFRAARLS